MSAGDPEHARGSRRLLRSVVPLQLLLAVATVGCAATESAGGDRIQRAIDAARRHVPDCADWMRAVALLEGVLRFDEAELQSIEGGERAPDHVSGDLLAYHLAIELDDPVCLLGGRDAATAYSRTCTVWPAHPDEVAKLRELSGRRIRAAVGDAGRILVWCDAESAEPAAMSAIVDLLTWDVHELVAAVGHSDAAVDEIVEDLFAGRRSAFEAAERLAALGTKALPAMAQRMSLSLNARHRGEGIRPGIPSTVVLDSYSTSCRCLFDVMCFVSMSPRGFQTGAPEDDEVRTAELRALAVWLLLRDAGGRDGAADA